MTENQPAYDISYESPMACSIFQFQGEFEEHNRKSKWREESETIIIRVQEGGSSLDLERVILVKVKVKGETLLLRCASVCVECLCWNRTEEDFPGRGRGEKKDERGNERRLIKIY